MGGGCCAGVGASHSFGFLLNFDQIPEFDLSVEDVLPAVNG